MSLFVKVVVYLGDLDMHSLHDGSQIRISLAADEEIVSWQARLFLTREFLLAVNEFLMSDRW